MKSAGIKITSPGPYAHAHALATPFAHAHTNAARGIFAAAPANDAVTAIVIFFMIAALLSASAQ